MNIAVKVVIVNNPKKRKLKMKNRVLVICQLLLICVMNAALPRVYGSSFQTQILTLQGKASGGKLCLVQLINQQAKFAEIETLPGEDAKSIVSRLIDCINSEDAFGWKRGVYSTEPPVLKVNDTSLQLPGDLGDYVFAGTEMGLNIPEAPTSLSARYDREKNLIRLFWENPNNLSDETVAFVDGFKILVGKDGIIDSPRLIEKVMKKGAWFRVVNIQKGMPSNAAFVYLKGNIQEDIFCAPFSKGVAPNWSAWFSGTESSIQLWQSDKQSQYVHDTVTTNDKGWPGLTATPQKAQGFCQMMSVSEPGNSGGIWRKFLGLAKGHRYQITARFNLQESNKLTGDCEVSLHAAAVLSNEVISAGHFMGTLAMPNGQSGPTAGRIVCFTKETKGNTPVVQYQMMLAENSDSIIVWIKIKGSQTATASFEGISLEDITP